MNSRLAVGGRTPGMLQRGVFLLTQRAGTRLSGAELHGRSATCQWIIRASVVLALPPPLPASGARPKATAHAIRADTRPEEFAAGTAHSSVAFRRRCNSR